MTNLPPPAMSVHLLRFDAAIAEVVKAATLLDIAPNANGPITLDTHLFRRRFHLPARLYGSGIRCQREVAAAAYAGGRLQTLPSMIDRINKAGITLPGMLPSLEAALGQGSFDAGEEDTRFSYFKQHGGAEARVFEDTWAELQSRVPLAPVTPDAPPPLKGCIDMPFKAAGFFPDADLEEHETNDEKVLLKPQNAICAHYENRIFRDLDASFKKLPLQNMQRTTWHCVNAFSAAFVRAIPFRGLAIPTTLYWEVWATYMAQPSPRALTVGLGLGHGTTRKLSLDAYGNTACATMRHINSGVGWVTLRHDAMEQTIRGVCKEYGLPVANQPLGLFSSYVDQAVLEEMNREARQHIIPDFHVIPHGVNATLADVKTISFCHSNYPNRYGNRPMWKTRAGAVERRQQQVDKDYGHAARAKDRLYNHTPQGTIGPMEQRLADFGRIRGLVFGFTGEASSDVQGLVDIIAKTGATTHWKTMGARSQLDAANSIKRLARTTLGMAAVRENARHKIARIGLLVSGDITAAKNRRVAAVHGHATRQAWYENRHGYGGPADDGNYGKHPRRGS